MNRAREDATARLGLLLVTTAGVALAALLPSLLGVADAPAPLALVVLTVALAAVARIGHAAISRAVTLPASSYAGGRRAQPVLAGRVTDPGHHPLRPRAPGTA